MTYNVQVSSSMTYEVEADNPERAQDIAAEWFLSDVIKILDVDTEIL